MIKKGKMLNISCMCCWKFQVFLYVKLLLLETLLSISACALSVTLAMDCTVISYCGLFKKIPRLIVEGHASRWCIWKMCNHRCELFLVYWNHFYIFDEQTYYSGWLYLSSNCIHCIIVKCKEKFVILQSIRITAIKSSETRAVIYTCRYN